jgi:hypothetical protein
MWNLKWWFINSIIVTTLIAYIVCRDLIECWVCFSGAIYDLAMWINRTFNVHNSLCQMTRWNHPPLTRQAAIKRRLTSRQYRTARVYIRATRQQRNQTRLLEKGQRPPISIILCCAASLQQVTHKEDLRFDTDSYKIGIDNCASCCVTDNKQDFVGLVTRSNTIVKGIRGNQNGNWIGTVKWPVTDERSPQ